jgi:transcriptional regulator with XRE-family HTH domain
MIHMTRKYLSDEIRDAVNASPLSRYSICKSLELSQPAMSRFMSGQGGLSLAVLDRLAALLDLHITVGLQREES